MQLLADRGGPGPSDADLDQFPDELDDSEDANHGASAPPSSQPGGPHNRVCAACS